MRRFLLGSLLGLAALAAFVPSAEACPYVTQFTIAESGTRTTEECWYNFPSMRIYQKVEQGRNINLYQQTQDCNGYTWTQFLYTVYFQPTSTCYYRTNRPCSGPWDWAPSPICG
jgi:hypothetical protein